MLDLNITPSKKRESAVDYVINTIKTLLLEKKLKPGDMLPSEGILSEAMNVSRGTIREAMKILSAFGIVEIKRGSGTFIAKPNNKDIVNPFLFKLILTSTDAREMAELREILETQIVTLVIKNASDHDLKELEQVHNDMKNLFNESNGNNQSKMLEYELKFHEALGKACNNVLVEEIYNFTMELFKPFVMKTYDNNEKGRIAIMLHEGIVEAIKERDISKAIDATRESIEEWRRIFELHYR